MKTIDAAKNSGRHAVPSTDQFSAQVAHSPVPPLGDAGRSVEIKTITRAEGNRVHEAVQTDSGTRPVCGGGYGAKNCHWQEINLSVDCLRCLTIKNPPVKEIDYEI